MLSIEHTFDRLTPMAVELREVLTHTSAVLDASPLASLDQDERRTLMHLLVDVEHSIDAMKTRIARADRDDPDTTDAVDTQLADGRVSGREARRIRRRLDVADVLPSLAARHDRAELSGAAIDVVAAGLGRCDEEARARLRAHEPEITRAAASLPIDVFRRRLSDLIRATSTDHGDDELARQIAVSSLEQWIDGDTGMGITRLQLDPIRHEELATQIRRELDHLVHTEKLEYSATSAATALLALVRPDATSGSAPRPEVVVIVDADTIRSGPHDTTVCETESGVDVPPSVLDRYLCDADLTAVVRQADGTIDRISKTKRVATAKQRRILASMYRTCAHDGCDVSFSRCQIHHIDEWDGSNTTLANLIPLCSRHHHQVHDAGWSHRLLPDRRLELVRPNGVRHRVGRPPDRRPSPPASGATTATDAPISEAPSLLDSTADAVPPVRAAA